MQSKGHKTGEASPINNSDSDVSQDDLVRAIIDEWILPALVTAFIREIGSERGSNADVESLSSQTQTANQPEKSAQQMEK